MNLSDKIKQILSQKNLTPSLFADEIGVQRSSISHILAGRNKPSLDIVQKIVKRFPELGLNWILEEEELPEIESDANNSLSGTKDQISGPKSNNTNASDLNVRKQIQAIPVQQIVNQPLKDENTERTVERVIIFYSDGTFQEFK